MHWIRIIALGSVALLCLTGCANSDKSLQSRIEHKLDNPETENEQISSAHYNTFSKGFEESWPFGPYSE
jgi:hypothetical protein